MTEWRESETRVKQFEAQAVEWGISLTERFELEALSRSNLKPSEDYQQDDWVDLEFRSQVAEILTEHGLMKKAQRFLLCSRQAFILRCKGEERHEFFSPCYCDLRFCGICGPRQFARLFAKHAPVLDHLRRNPRKGFRLRQLTLTSENVGVIIHAQIKTFNAYVKRTLQLLMNGVEGWGAIAVLEVGFNNTNLHAHILTYCPYIEQRKLARVWHDVSGDQVVWIKMARGSGHSALGYQLKYVSKPPSDKPEIVGALEVAFHKTRRVHCYGVFYNFAGEDEDGEKSAWLQCPKCGADLERVKRPRHVYELRREGLKFIGDFPRKRSGRKWVN